MKKNKDEGISVNERRQYKSGGQEMNFIVQQLVKNGNTKSDAIKMTQKHYNNVLKRYKEPWFVHPIKKAEIISSLSANESVNEKKDEDDEKWSGIGYDSYESVTEGKANIYGIEYRKFGQSGAKFQKSSLTMVSHQGRKMHKKMTMAILTKADKLRKQDKWADYRITVNGAPYIGWGGGRITKYPPPKLNESPWADIHGADKTTTSQQAAANVNKMSDKKKIEYLLYIKKYKPKLYQQLRKNPKVSSLIANYVESVDEGFGGDLKGKDKKEFEKARKENAEQLGYELTGKSDIRESDLPTTSKKEKTIRAVHKKSGKEVVYVDTPSVRKKLKRMGFVVKEYSGMSKWQRDRLDQRSKEKAPKGKKVSKALQKKQDAWAKKYYTKGGGINIAKWKKDGSPRFPKESVNEAGMEMNKLKDAIKMFQKKIEKQGRITNARDEEHLSNLIKLYKQMGGKGVKESVNEAINHPKVQKQANQLAKVLKDVVTAAKKDDRKLARKLVGNIYDIYNDLDWTIQRDLRYKESVDEAVSPKGWNMSKKFITILGREVKNLQKYHRQQNEEDFLEVANYMELQLKYMKKNLKESVNEDVYYGYYKDKEIKVNAKSDSDAKKQIVSKLKVPMTQWDRVSMTNHTKNKKNRHKFESINEAPGKSGKDVYVGQARVKVEPGTYKGQKVNFHDVSMYRDHKKPYHYYLSIRLAHSNKVDMVIDTGTHIQSKAGKWAQGFIKRRMSGTGKERFS